MVSYILPSASVFAHDKHHGDEMVDIIVRYYDEVPDEEDLDPSYENVESFDILPIQTMRVPSSEVKKLSQQDNVKRISYDQDVRTSQTDYLPTDNSWNLEAINAFAAWNENLTGSGVSVAVIDTGFHQHPDIAYAGGYSVFEDETTFNINSTSNDSEEEDSYETFTLPPDPWTNDHTGHGTHVAGIIGAQQTNNFSGIAPSVDLYGVKVYHQDQGNRTYLRHLMQGIEWAIGQSVDIINISSGYPNHNQEIYDLIEIGTENDILFVAANGNTDESSVIDYPARYSEVISVASVSQDENGDWVRSSTSLSGEETELSAPGQGILGPWTDNGYHTLSGTSQATPHVTGIAALLMQQNPGMSASSIRSLMQQEAIDLQQPGRDQATGFGLVQFPSVEEDEPDEPDNGDEDPTEEEEPNEPDDENEGSSEGGEDESETAPPSDNNGQDSNGQSGDDESTVEEDTNEEEDAEDSDDEESADLSSAVWIRPSNSNGIATIEDGDLEAIADNGTIALSFDSSITHLTRVVFTPQQVAEIRERGITVLIAKTEIEWVIPSENFEEGDATLRFEFPEDEIPFEEESTSNLYQFTFIQNGNERSEFPENMIYRFFVEHPEENGEVLYEWRITEEEWIELGDTYSNGTVVGLADYTGTFAVFHPAVLAQDNRDIIDTQRVDAASSEEDQDGESDDQYLTEDSSSSSLAYTLGGVIVIGLSFGGGFYYFGKNKSS